MKNDKGRNYVTPNWDFAKKHGWRAKQDALNRGDEVTADALQNLILEGQKEIDHWMRVARSLGEK